MLSDRCLSCLSDLSVTLVHCGQTAGRIKMKLGMQVRLGPVHIVLDGDPAPLPQRAQPLQFSAHICCGQMAAWIKMSFGMELVWTQPPTKGVEHPPKFSAHVYCGQTAGWIKMALGSELGLGPVHIVLDLSLIHI